MKLIEPDEVDNFHGVLQRYRLLAVDFVLTQTDTTDAKTDEIEAMTGFVVVTQKSTNHHQQYPIGDGSRWVEDFERDCEKKLFEAPAAPV